MKLFADALIAAAALSEYSTIQIMENGIPETLYVASYFKNSAGNTIDMPFNSGAVLIESPTVDPNHFYKPNLLGGSVDYDVDLSLSNCGCIAAFYLFKAPGKDVNGNPWNTDGYYYCDANQVGGNFCPEFDIMEANQWAF